jgi:hypothetical protein
MGIQKYRAGSMSMAAEYGLGVSDVRVVEQTEFDSIPLASGSNTSDLTLAVKSNSDSDSDGGNIYLIAGGKRYLITSMGLLSEYGFTVDQIGYLPLLELERMPLTANLSTFAQSPNGFLYRVEGGVNKRGIFQMEVFNSVNPSGAFTPLSDFILSRYSTTTALIGVPIVMQSSDGKIWYARSSGWHYIPSMQEYKCLGLNNIEPLRFTSAQTQVGSILTPATCLLRHSSGSTFIANGSSKLPIQNAWLPINTTSLGDEILNTKSAGAITQSSVFKSDNGALYTLGGGTKRHIMNVAVLDELGVSLGSVVDVRGGAIADIQNDIPRFATRTVIQDETNGKLYFMAKDVLYYIPTMRVFSDFGLSTESIVKMQPSNIAKFTAGGELSRVARLTSGGGAVMDKGKTFIVPDALLGDFGITGATPQYPREVITSNQVTATKFIKSSTSAQLYILSGGTKRAVATWSLFVSLGGSQSNITSMSSQAVDTIPSGPNM